MATTKPTAKSEKPDPAASEGAAKPKSKKLLLIIIAVLVLAAGGGAGWYFTKGDQPTVEAKVEPLPPKFIALAPFTVNLQSETGGQFLQVGLTLKIVEPDQKAKPSLEEKINLAMPEIRSRLLLLLSGKYPAELAPAEGKKKLVQEIIAEINSALGLHSASASPAPKPHEGDQSGATSGMIAAPETVHNATSGVTAAPVTASVVAAAPVTARGDNKKDGIMDVLFTSFIIQ